MSYADEIGLQQVSATLERLRTEHGPAYWTPAPLLARLAAEGRRFGDLN
jgi:3-hydroxyacyl-CoA dehydrogenase